MHIKMFRSHYESCLQQETFLIVTMEVA